MDTPTIAKYYREKDPMERLKLLEQSIAAGEEPEENKIRKELWDIRYSDKSVLFQEFVPFVHAAFESYVIDSAFGPDQIEFFLLKWQSVHGTDDTLYSVFTMGFYCIFVE